MVPSQGQLHRGGAGNGRRERESEKVGDGALRHGERSRGVHDAVVIKVATEEAEKLLRSALGGGGLMISRFVLALEN